MKRIKSQSLSEEVKSEIYQYIKDTYDGKNNKLPTEDQFAKNLGVSRITIRTALNELASEGIIFRRQGKGTFINPQAISMKVPFHPVALFSNMISQCGYKPDMRFLGVERSKADHHIADCLQIESGTDIIITKKIFFADNKPCAYCEDYFSDDLLTKTNDIDIISEYKESLFYFIEEKCGRKITWDKVEIMTCTNQEYAPLTKYFDCAGEVKSFLHLDCINFDDNDCPVVYAKEYIDTNYICFNSIRQKLY